MAKLDIMLPYWGDFNLLKKTVESVMGQTCGDWHLIVVDDCYPSDDAKKYFSTITDPRIEYRRHDKNIGITKNFNYCIQAATSDYCAIIGCDDILLPNYVETALSNIGNADMYQPGVRIIDAKGRQYRPLVDNVKRALRPKKQGVYQGEPLALSLSRGNWLYFPSITWRTATLRRYQFNEAYKITQDVMLEMNLIIDGGTLYLDNTVTFLYRRFSESLSSKEKSGIRFDEESSTYMLLADQFTHKGWHRAARTARRHLLSRVHRLLS